MSDDGFDVACDSPLRADENTDGEDSSPQPCPRGQYRMNRPGLACAFVVCSGLSTAVHSIQSIYATHTLGVAFSAGVVTVIGIVFFTWSFIQTNVSHAGL